MAKSINFIEWVIIVILIIASTSYIINNAGMVVVEEQTPSSQEPWDIVYPKFKDDVSDQLLNTQKIAGIVANDTSEIKAQNANLKYSVDVLLNNLGILQQTSREESIRQRNEQIIATVASVLIGWVLGVFVTPENFKKYRNRFSTRRIEKISESQNPTSEGIEEEKIPKFFKLLFENKIAEVIVIGTLILLMIAIILLGVLLYINY